MPIVEVLIASTAGVVVKFLLDQVEKYREGKGKKTKEIAELEKTLAPFDGRARVNEAELQQIKATTEKLSEKMSETSRYKPENTKLVRRLSCTSERIRLVISRCLI